MAKGEVKEDGGTYEGVIIEGGGLGLLWRGERGGEGARCGSSHRGNQWANWESFHS